MIERLYRARPAHALALAGLLMPPLATVAPLSLAPLLALAAMGALMLGGYRELWRLGSVSPLVIAMAVLGVFGTASAAWSIIPLHSFLEGLRFLAISAGGLVVIAVALSLTAEEQDGVQRWLILGVVLALVVLALAGLARALWDPFPAGAPLALWLRRFTVFDRGATTLALAVWPAAWGLGRRGKRLAVALLLIAALAAVLALRSRSAMLCLLVGLAVSSAAWWRPRLAAAALGAGLLALAVAFPAAPLGIETVVRIHQAVPRLDNSMIHRLAIWHFAIDRIAERPILGWGLDASRALPGGSEIIEDPGLPELARPDAPWMPLHPHNAALQWRLELGLPGTVLGSFVVLWVLWRIGSAATVPRGARASSLALIAGALVVAMVSYGIWQAWWQSSLWLMAALSLALAGNETRPASGPH
jgi:exopolysaccharide production protein ExoQ